MISNLFGEPNNVFQHMMHVPYDTTPPGVYSAATLYKGYDHHRPETFATCYDQAVYKFFIIEGKITTDPKESMARASHDHYVLQGIYDLFRKYDPRQVVGVMGGSAMKRTDDAYRQIVLIAKHLTEAGSLMVSGGGSGAMEATSLGGFLAGRDDSDIDQALEILVQAPDYHSPGYMETAFEVIDKLPSTGQYNCLAIPTWLYGHEPTAPFASHIGKLFWNSVREDILLTVSFGGIIFTPGSAGTMQEIFQEAVQNHYLTLGIASPMVFLGEEFWTETMPAYAMLKHLSETGRYKNLLLSITDDPATAVATILDFQRTAKGK